MTQMTCKIAPAPKGKFSKMNECALTFCKWPKKERIVAVPQTEL
jgi:hypothetical protein